MNLQDITSRVRIDAPKNWIAKPRLYAGLGFKPDRFRVSDSCRNYQSWATLPCRQLCNARGWSPGQPHPAAWWLECRDSLHARSGGSYLASAPSCNRDPSKRPDTTPNNQYQKAFGFAAEQRSGVPPKNQNLGNFEQQYTPET